MIIATWNVERLKHKAQLTQIKGMCEQMQADILVLTETDRRLHPDFPFCIETPSPKQPLIYESTENRVSIFTRYPCIEQIPTYDPYTAVCARLATERGDLMVYGTIIGIYGNRHPTFAEALHGVAKDMKHLWEMGKGICFCGDYNCSFTDNYYYTISSRVMLSELLKHTDLRLLTEKVPECIDHIAISETFLKGSIPIFREWNTEKCLSDHKGVSVTL